jgi:hypothetical protein
MHTPPRRGKSHDDVLPWLRINEDSQADLAMARRQARGIDESEGRCEHRELM